MATRYFALKEDRACLALGGEDAREFLQGMISNDVEKVTADCAIYAGFLTAQGRFLHDLFIASTDDGSGGQTLLLDGEAPRLDDLKRRLALYKLRAKVTITDQREALGVFAIWGSDVASALDLPADAGAARSFVGGIAFIDPRLLALGARALLPRADAEAALRDAGFVPGALSGYQRLRISLGVPEGSSDMPVEKALPLENGFEELHGVDFKKGCYVGQEVTARMKYRALVKKRLMPVEIEGPTPSPGTPVMFGEEEAGEFRSSIDGLGLALLKLDLVEKTGAGEKPLTAGNAILRPRKPDWFA